MSVAVVFLFLRIWGGKKTTTAAPFRRPKRPYKDGRRGHTRLHSPLSSRRLRVAFVRLSALGSRPPPSPEGSPWSSPSSSSWWVLPYIVITNRKLEKNHQYGRSSSLAEGPTVAFVVDTKWMEASKCQSIQRSWENHAKPDSRMVFRPFSAAILKATTKLMDRSIHSWITFGDD